MKLSLVTATAIAALAILSSACGTSEADKEDDGPKPQPTTAPPDSAPPRQLIDGKALATSPVNLLPDPGFGLVGSEQGYGGFIGFYDGGSQLYALTTTLDSRSPAGFGGSVALVRPDKATNSKSRTVNLVASFLGGKGPFHAKIWASKSNVKGEPVDIPTDQSAVRVSIMSGSLNTTDAFDLEADPTATRTIAGRTWILLRGDITTPLDEGGFFVVRTGTAGGHIHLAAPEVTSDEVAVGQAVQSHAPLKLARARPQESSERIAIKAYQAIPPRLMPASPKPILAD